MHVRRLLSICAVAFAALAAQPAAAQNCAGFTDVQAASLFCPSVEWMKNRGITTGCGGTDYCPNAAVDRLAMSAFMKRLGDALTPAFVRKRDPAIGGLNLTGQQNICVTDPVPISGYPRAAIVRGLVNLYTPTNGGMDVKAWIVYSTNGGTTWLNPATNDGTAFGALYPGLTPPNDISLHPMTVINLDVGSTYHFALAAQIQAGDGTVANVYCENLVQLVNRVGTPPGPLDAPVDTGPHGRAN